MNQPIHGPAARAAMRLQPIKEPWNHAERLQRKMQGIREVITSEIPTMESRLRLWTSYREGVSDPVAKELITQAIWDVEQILRSLRVLKEYTEMRLEGLV